MTNKKVMVKIEKKSDHAPHKSGPNVLAKNMLIKKNMGKTIALVAIPQDVSFISFFFSSDKFGGL